MARRWRKTVLEYIPAVLTFAGILAFWHFVTTSGRIPEYLVPAPLDVARRLVSGAPLFSEQSLPTMAAISGGFLFAILIGIPLAVFMVYSRPFHRTVYPLLVSAQVVPKVALAPIFVVWFGFGLQSKMLMSFLIAFFPVVIAATAGLSATRPQSLMLIRSMGGNVWQEFAAVRWPHALPNIFAGLKVSVTLAVVGAVVGEFVGSDNGLGYLLVLARGAFDTVTIFAVIIWLSVLGMILFWLVEVAERLLVPGAASRRAKERDKQSHLTM